MALGILKGDWLRSHHQPPPKRKKIKMEEIINELKQLKELTLLGAKTALNMNDVCLLTGLSKSHVYKLVWKKKIPYYKSDGGKLTYFNKQEIENWLLTHRVSTDEELEQAAIKHCVSNKKGGARC